jgi:hypothetical protein
MTVRVWRRRRARTAEPEPKRAEQPPRVLIEPTPEEARNGWTAETLTADRESIRDATAYLFAPRRPPLPTRSHGKYSPHRGLSYSPFSRFRRGR